MASARPFRACKVLLVDEYLELDERARALFEGELVSCGRGVDFAHAVSAVQQVKPDVIIVDLTNAAAFLAVQAIMAEHPTPIFVLRPAHLTHIDPFAALALGALDVAERRDADPPEYWRELGRKLKLLSQVQVVRHMKGRKRARSQSAGSGAPFPVVAIASSLGGPKALSVVLGMLPKTFRAPICVCQHISQGFTEELAQWLSKETSLSVLEAVDGAHLRAGTVCIAPSGAHLLVQNDGKIKLDYGPPLMGFKPSCNALLSSVAESFGAKAIGVVLTGMGKDGAHGLLDIRNRGGHTIAQDEATCVVFGMPREAVQLGAAEEVLAVEHIAAALIRLVDAC